MHFNALTVILLSLTTLGLAKPKLGHASSNTFDIVRKSGTVHRRVRVRAVCEDCSLNLPLGNLPCCKTSLKARTDGHEEGGDDSIVNPNIVYACSPKHQQHNHTNSSTTPPSGPPRYAPHPITPDPSVNKTNNTRPHQPKYVPPVQANEAGAVQWAAQVMLLPCMVAAAFVW